jgi:hypothetical protein
MSLAEAAAMRGVVLVCLAGCYTGAPANRDVARVWQGRTSAELETRWGAPQARDRDGDATVATWTFERTHVELPSGELHLASHPVVIDAVATTGPGGAHVHAEGNLLEIAGAFHPGAIVHTSTAAVALVDPAGTVERIDGAALHWGPPNDANLHWGMIYGAHVGMGRLDTTSTPLPSGGAYAGGMLGPTLGLVGVFDLSAGTSDAGGAMGMAAGVAAQWWPVNRLWLRAGPAMLLTFDPGFTAAALRPGVTAGASYAVVKIGVLAIDLRAELAAGTTSAFGSLGVGIAVN